jgi:hypothetical protein
MNWYRFAPVLCTSSVAARFFGACGARLREWFRSRASAHFGEL